MYRILEVLGSHLGPEAVLSYVSRRFPQSLQKIVQDKS
jgi:hypothetical protein